MTVCIAALADGGARAVLVSDKLVAMSFMGWSAEKDHPAKIHYVSDTAAILAAGDLNAAQEVAASASRLYGGGEYGHLELGEIVRYAYERVRLSRVEHAYL